MDATADEHSFRAALQQGQQLEAHGRFAEAIAAYDAALVHSRHNAQSRGVAWMNRGNVLQKMAPADDGSRLDAALLADAVAAYDQAVVCFASLPQDPPLHRNQLGAAWLNRGHTHLSAGAMADAVASLERAAAILGTLPLDDEPHFRLNLAGTHVNLAHATIESDPRRACAEAARALSITAGVERTHPVFAAMDLRARRALVIALGERLRLGESDTTRLVGEATDAIDDGLALARHFAPAQAEELHALALRLFVLGAQLYALEQPHFLCEFLLENTDAEAGAGAFAGDEVFLAVALDTLNRLHEQLRRPRVLQVGDRATERVLALSREIAATTERLTRLRPPPASQPLPSTP